MHQNPGRNDDPEENKADEIWQPINDSHRFEEERAGNFVKGHIDGHDYMWVLSELIDNAREAIFILVCPCSVVTLWSHLCNVGLVAHPRTLPPSSHPEYHLDRLLKRKAEQGVKIYDIVYKAVKGRKRYEMALPTHCRTEMDYFQEN